ncbi:hypothetical protein FLM01_15945 [Vibrio cholerae]|uniref:hypothetical protein n=1 Tax=Vibrio cholerae TaxID=666 RepID=UPI001158735A|nr:hypothetical protein [Vibrio cholerae]TQP33527.1 hypothetical protein FLM01_15945 [Vibrio cholerae]
MNFKKNMLTSAFIMFASASAIAAPKTSTVQLNLSAVVPDSTFAFELKGLASNVTVNLDYVGGKFADKVLPMQFTGKADATNDLKASLIKNTLANGADTLDLDVAVIDGIDSTKLTKLSFSPASIVTPTADVQKSYENLKLKVSQPAGKNLVEGEYKGTVAVLFEAGI